MSINKFAGEARQRVTGFACKAAVLAGRGVLDRQETTDWLSTRGLPPVAGSVGVLPASTRPSILKWGVVRAMGRQCLDFDYGARSALLGWVGVSVRCENAAAVWSHPWMGYYHWMIDVAPKIALFQSHLGNELDGWKLCYPRTGERYEIETLEMLGVPGDAIMDTRQIRTVEASQVAYCRLPGWYEIQTAAMILRERILGLISPRSGQRRIYLSRCGRRKCTNENEVFAALRERKFEFVEDIPRSVEEQIRIFGSAGVVVAPHGAALTNLLWCRKGTKVVEMFHPNYRPIYYERLSEFVGLDYVGLCADSGRWQHWSAMNEDMSVDVRGLLQQLDIMGIT